MDTSKQARLDWIEELRPRWMDAVRPFDGDLEYPFKFMPVLEPRHTANCRVAPHRNVMVATMLPHGGRVAEVGTFRGGFSKVILESANPSELHLIDVSFALLDRGPLEEAIRAGRVILHEGDSATTLATLPKGAFDWVYIDAGHTYSAVKRDIEAAKHLVTSDGYLVFNDYIYWSHPELMEYGVIQAVNELCLNEGWEMAVFAFEPQMYCDVALRRLR